MPPPVQRATATASAPAAPPFTTTTTAAATPSFTALTAPATPTAPPFAALATPAVPPFAAPATSTAPAAPHLTPPPLPGGGGATPPVVQRAPAKAVPLRKPGAPGGATGAPLPVAPLTPPRPSAARPEMPVATQAVPADTTPDALAPAGTASADLPPVQRFSFRRSHRAARTTAAALASVTAATVADNLSRLHTPSSRPGPDEPPPPYSDPPPPYEAGAGSPPPDGPPPAYTAVPEGGFDPRELTDFQLDELVHRIIGRVTRLVRTELRMDRERIGRLRDPR
ncbi:hypothetical protein [Streptomyces rubrogriseus]|uniref:hypothetical protein n=1 Tax=Streptomyces rubrogriseus TaxID=194673 RepID=UPI003660E3AA